MIIPRKLLNSRLLILNFFSWNRENWKIQITRIYTRKIPYRATEFAKDTYRGITQIRVVMRREKDLDNLRPRSRDSRSEIWLMRKYVNARGKNEGTRGRRRRRRKKRSRSIIQCVLLPMCAARAVLLFSNNFPCNSAEREPIKVQARDLASRQEPVPRV